MNEIRNCSECGKQFTRSAPRSLTCSHECGRVRNLRSVADRYRARVGPAKLRASPPPPSMAERTCVVCATTFVGRAKRLYCSDLCRYRGRPGFVPVELRGKPEPPEKATRVVYRRLCPECGTEFSTGFARKTTCSIACRMAIRNRKNRVPAAKQKPRGVGPVRLVTCTECGTAVETTSTKPKLTCSKSCSIDRGNRRAREAKSAHPSV